MKPAIALLLLLPLGCRESVTPESDANGTVIATLSHDIVQRTDTAGQVKTADGKVGSVDPDKLRSPVGYRAGLNKVAGTWRMTAFVAGD